VDEQWGPGGRGRALTLDLECRTSKDAASGAPHPVTITTDWRFESPHDLAAERVAVAFGGFTSCLGVAEYAVPALHEAVRLHARIAPVPVARSGERGWMVNEPVPGCTCQKRFFSTPAVAASHARDPGHLALKHGAVEDLLGSLIRASLGALAQDRPPLDGPGAPKTLVREGDGLARLWAVGVHPDRVRALADLVPGCTEPLPVAYYLGAATRDLDRTWLTATLAQRPDPDVAAWVAWSEEAVGPVHRPGYGHWLGLGVPVRAVEALVEAGVPTSAVLDLSAATGLSPLECAKVLAVWAEVQCRPTADHLAILARHGVHRGYRPPVTAVNLLAAVADTHPDPPTRTDLAVMLAIAGNRRQVLDLLDRGVRTPADASPLL
jgi:hypothetical protein